MNLDQISEKIIQYKKYGKKIFATSSFQTQSIPLLHIISTIDNTIPIYFLNTGYLFPETIFFKDEIKKRLALKIISLRSFIPKINQKDDKGNLLYISDPDYCCYINKIQPLETILVEYDVWINGIRKDQSENRNQMQTEEKTSFKAVRFHPLLHWTNEMIYEYIKQYNLPINPLVEKGYISVGCEPCTRKFENSKNTREARWYGLRKTECGLHTSLRK